MPCIFIPKDMSLHRASGIIWYTCRRRKCHVQKLRMSLCVIGRYYNIWEQSPEVLEFTTIWSGSSTKFEHIQGKAGQALEGVLVYHRCMNYTAQDKHPYWSNWKPAELISKRLRAYKLKYDTMRKSLYFSAKKVTNRTYSPVNILKTSVDFPLRLLGKPQRHFLSCGKVGACL